MAEYIEREAANDWLMDMFYSPDDEGCKELVERFNKAIPAADVVPVRHGRWLSMDSGNMIAMDDDGCPVDSCRCSECGDWLTGSDEYMVRGRFCPNCGALMDKDGDGDV